MIAAERQQWAHSSTLGRHRHENPYLALVLEGGYHEAGDLGRREVRSGDVLIHAAYEAHCNRFGHGRTVILNLPCPPNVEGRAGRIDDVDGIVRLAEQDAVEAADVLLATLTAGIRVANDWPDHLAEALAADPTLRIDEWARTMSIRPSSVSRGFEKAFGIAPASYRAEIRTSRAIRAIIETQRSLAEIAASLGFSDQAHMTRSVRAMASLPPIALRAKFVQDGNLHRN